MNKIILMLIAIPLLNGCNNGASDHPATTNPYTFQQYNLSSITTGNCTTGGNSIINCTAQGTFVGTFRVTFNTPKGSPGAYLIMPPTGDTYGVNIAPAGDCPQTAPENGETYVCTFSIAANGTAQSGHSINLQVNGKLGSYTAIIINLK